MRDDEIRDEGEGVTLHIESGDTSPNWSPVRCGWYVGGTVVLNESDNPLHKMLYEAGQRELTVREDFICSQHMAEFLGTSEDRVARLGLVRDDFFNVWSVEAMVEKELKWERDADACKRDWFGSCLWPMGEVVLWVPNELALEKLLEGWPIEDTLSGEYVRVVWKP